MTKPNPFEREAEKFITHFYMQTPAAKLIYLGSIDKILQLANIQPDEKVIDLGCGSGVLLKNVQKITTDFIGVDSSKEMVELAKTHLPPEKLRVGDVRDMPQFADNSFDVVLNRAIFQHLEPCDHDSFLINVKRIIKPKGRFITFVPVDSPLWRTARTLSAVLVKERSRISGVMYSLPYILSKLKEHGFSIQRVKFYGWLFYPLSGYGTGLSIPIQNRILWKFLIAIDNLICRIPLINKFGAINVLIEAQKKI